MMDSFTHCSSSCRPDARWPATLASWLVLLALLLGGLAPRAAHAATIEDLSLAWDDDSLRLSGAISLELGPAVEDAVMRAVPVYFVSQAEVFRER